MNQKNLGKTAHETKKVGAQERTYPRPAWVAQNVASEEELCPDCFKVVGERNRYKIVCILGKEAGGLSVGEITKQLKLRQPTVTHHLQVLRSVNAVECEKLGRECIYELNRKAHCFKECKIPY